VSLNDCTSFIFVEDLSAQPSILTEVNIMLDDFYGKSSGKERVIPKYYLLKELQRPSGHDIRLGIWGLGFKPST